MMILEVAMEPAVAIISDYDNDGWNDDGWNEDLNL